MKLLLSDGSLYKHPIKRFIHIASNAGFDGIEVIWDGKEELEPENILSLCNEFSTPLLVIHEPFDFHDIKGWPKDRCERLPFVIDLAERMNVPSIVVHAGTNAKTIRWQVENIPKLQKKTDVRICVENMPVDYALFKNKFQLINSLYRKYFGNIYPACTSTLVQRLLFMSYRRDYSMNAPERLSFFDHITLDTTHVGTTGLYDPSEYFDSLGKASHIHLSDFGCREHLLPGQGNMALKEFMSHVQASGYQNCVSIEVNPSAFSDPDDDISVIRQLKDVISYLSTNSTGH
ncbi:MAG: sugar phosphate isomerase/epimerase family protein [Candidatus Muiribacteriaceae bacterium]